MRGRLSTYVGEGCNARTVPDPHVVNLHGNIKFIKKIHLPGIYRPASITTCLLFVTVNNRLCTISCIQFRAVSMSTDASLRLFNN